MLDIAGLLQRAKFLLNENSATILTGVGVTGTATTAYLSGRASFKAAHVIEHARQEYVKEENLPELEMKDLPEDYKNYLEEKRMLKFSSKAKLVWKFYIPAVGSGATTIVCIVMANQISARRIAALAVASGISERALQEYKAKVVEKLGEKHEMAIRDEVAQDRVNANPPGSSQVIVAGTGDVLCYDMTTGRYFRSSMEDIKKAENKVNYEILHFMSASLSSFYDEIGLPPTNYTDMVGWNMNTPLEVKFSTVMSPDNQPCIAIDFSRPPIADYDKHWD